MTSAEHPVPAPSTDPAYDDRGAPPKLCRGWDGLPRVGHKHGPLWLTHPYFRTGGAAS